MLRKPTELRRITCKQELALLVDAEAGVSSSTTRRVQLLLPEGASFHFSIDTPTPPDVALGRLHQVPFVPGNTTVDFSLQPTQRIFGAVESGIAEASVIIEYLED